jgi:hypothetical protein
MNTAETQIAEIVAWLSASAWNWISPLGDRVIPGPFATIINVGIDDVGHVDFSAAIAEQVLPLLTPQSTAVAADLTPPTDQPNRAVERALEILWKVEQGHIPKVVVIGLETADTSIQTALTDAGLESLDLTERGVLALPLYAFAPEAAERIAEKLPLT